MLSYRSQTEKSSGSGKKRASTFDMSTELEELRMEQSLANGVQLLYMTQQHWLLVANEKHGKSASEAQEEWEATLKRTPAHKQRGSGKNLKLPMPDEEYNKSAPSKAFQMSKASKIKDGVDMAKGASSLDHGSFALNEPFFKGSGSLLTEAAAMASMNVSPDSKTPGSSVALQQAVGKPDKQAADKKKKKKFDVLAARNRCQTKLKDDFKKLRGGLTNLMKEGQDLLAKRAGCTEYACYIKILKQRLSLVEATSANVEFDDVRSVADVQKLAAACFDASKLELSKDVLNQVATVQDVLAAAEAYKPESADHESQKATLEQNVQKLGQCFPQRDADGHVLTAHGRMVPVEAGLLADPKPDGNISISAKAVETLQSLMPEFLTDHVSECLLAAALGALESLPLDDVSKLRPIRLVEKSLTSQLQEADDED